jgi:hypothetical protein
VPADDDRLRALARSSGLSRTEIRRYVQLDLVSTADGTVRPGVMRRLRRARRLRRDLGLSVDAVVIVLRLLDRIDALEGRTTPSRRARVFDE